MSERHVNIENGKGIDMELRDYIDAGTAKAGSLTALGKMLDVSQPNMSHAKAQKKRLPIDAITRLSELIGTDLRVLISTSVSALTPRCEFMAVC